MNDIRPQTVIEISADDVATSSPIKTLVREFRANADGFIFLSGGASKMSAEIGRRVQGLVNALAILVSRGIRFAVGDGGTKAGMMEAAGTVRIATGGPFLLLGVAPAEDVTTTSEPGKTPVDPGHSHIVTVRDPGWEEAQAARGWDASRGHWGSEIPTMYAIFARLSRQRTSVTVVANGGEATLDEVRHNIAQRRPMIVVEHSGRAADAVVATIRRTVPSDEEARQLLSPARALGITGHSDLFEILPIDAGPDGLAARLAARLAGRSTRTRKR